MKDYFSERNNLLNIMDLGYPLIRSAVGFHKGQFLGPTFISYINYLNNASKLESLVFADEKVLKTMFYLSVC